MGACAGVCAPLLAALLLAALAGGGAGGEAVPGDEERRFQALRAELMAHADAMPPGGGVAAVNASFERPIPIRFDCAPGAPLDRVTIEVTTTFQPWEQVEAAKGEAGVYAWKFEITEGGAQTRMRAANVVSLDPEALRENGDASLARFANLALVYHELLHGQIGIDEIRGNGTWQRAVCESRSPGFPSTQAQHERMRPLVHAFLTNLAGNGTRVTVVEPEPAQASVQGEFRVPLGRADDLFGAGKEAPRVRWSLPQGSNVEADSLDVAVREGQVLVEGRLVNATEPGFFLAQIDPPSAVVLVGVESGAWILPFEAQESQPPRVTPATDGARAMVVLLASGLLLRRRRLSPR